MANANALCFIFPFSLVSKTTPVVQRKALWTSLPFLRRRRTTLYRICPALVQISPKRLNCV